MPIELPDPAARFTSGGTPPPVTIAAPAPPPQPKADIYGELTEEEGDELLGQLCDGDGFLPGTQEFERTFQSCNKCIVQVSSDIAEKVVSEIAAAHAETLEILADLHGLVSEEIRAVGQVTIEAAQAIALWLYLRIEEVAHEVELLKGDVQWVRSESPPGTTSGPPPGDPTRPVRLPPMPPRPDRPRPADRPGTADPTPPPPPRPPTPPTPAPGAEATPTAFVSDPPAEICPLPEPGAAVGNRWPFPGATPLGEFPGGVPITEGFPGRAPTELEVILSPLFAQQAAYLRSALPTPAGAPCDWFKADPGELFKALVGPFYKGRGDGLVPSG